MDKMLESISNLPWPMFLLILILIVVAFVYFQVLIPSFKELDLLRDLINTKLVNMETNISIIEKKLTSIQSIFSSKGDAYVEKIADLEDSVALLKSNLDKNMFTSEKIIDKISDIKERLFIIQNSRVTDEYRGVK